MHTSVDENNRIILMFFRLIKLVEFTAAYLLFHPGKRKEIFDHQNMLSALRQETESFVFNHLHPTAEGAMKCCYGKLTGK